jgi:4-hydroxy-2-oxoheptanedioate aldolase
MVLVKRLLDGGAESLVVPYVQTEAEARAAVAATRYPPAGVRGVAGANRTSAYGRVKDYLRRAQDEIAIVVQIETRMAMDNLEAIVGVEGIDGILIGPGDLAASLGHLGDPGHPEVREAIAEIARRTLAAGSAPGMFCMGEVEVEQALGMGFRFISMGIDIALMRNAADALVRRFRP